MAKSVQLKTGAVYERILNRLSVENYMFFAFSVLLNGIAKVTLIAL